MRDEKTNQAICPSSLEKNQDQFRRQADHFEDLLDMLLLNRQGSFGEITQRRGQKKGPLEQMKSFFKLITKYQRSLSYPIVDDGRATAFNNSVGTSLNVILRREHCQVG